MAKSRSRERDLHERALPKLQEVAVGNPRLGALLDQIERGRERQDAPAPTEGGRTIADMGVGETAYVPPWAMQWTKDGGHCLRPDYLTENAPGGTVQMRIMRTTDGFHVWWSGDIDRRYVEWLDGSLPVVKIEAAP